MRLAFIGGHGHHYLRAALSDPALHIARPVPFAGDGVDDDKARAMADALGDIQWFEDARRMLDTTRPDAVSVGAVYARNGGFVTEALERDVPVVSDKPVAADWETLRRIQNLTKETNRTLLTEFPFRSQPEFRAVRAAVAAGEIGDVALATAQKSYKFGARPPWYADRALYGGTLLWIASHGIDAIRFVTGQKLRCVCGQAGNVSRPDYGGMEDHTVSVFALAGGGAGIVHADFLQAGEAASHGDDRLRLAGSRGTLEVRDGRCVLTTHDRPSADITERVAARPVHQELLAALRGETTEYYSTEASLEIAELLLQARDVADGK